MKSVFSLITAFTVLFIFSPNVFALATAQGVALDTTNANCNNSADLNITFTSDANVTRESGLVTNTAGVTLGQFEQSSGFQNFSGTFLGYGQPIDTPQPAGTLIGSYAYVGNTPPTAATAEFFVMYNCSTQQVLYSCFGQFGTCPQTAQQAQAILNAGKTVPTMTEWGMMIFAMLAGISSVYYIRRQKRA
jgi:hypothetical protein